MALLWCDGFDHYGSSIAKLLDGAWAETGGALCTLSTVQTRTGTYAIRSAGLAGTQPSLRRVLGGSRTTVGIGAAIYLDSLPTNNNSFRLWDYRDAGNVTQLSIGVQSTGTIVVTRGPLNTGTVLYTTPTPAVVADAYQHIESLATINDTTGAVEVRVNGVTVVSLSGVDTCATGNVECSQLAFLTSPSTGGATAAAYMDDLFVYDNSGTYNNTFIGDRRVLTLFPNANTATADWTVVGAASGYEAIDEASPDDDTSYITATTTGQVSEFGLQNLPDGISVVSAVVMVERARKTEAGPASTQVSIVSGASVASGANKPITEVYTYRHDVFETDPASAAPMTPAEFDALKFKVERTA